MITSMGKDKKEKLKKSGLAEDILDGSRVKNTKRVKQRSTRQGEIDESVSVCLKILQNQNELSLCSE